MDTLNLKCIVCGNKRNATRKKYCSIRCTKLAWSIKNKGTKSYIAHNEDFFNTETGKGFTWEAWFAKKIGAKHTPFSSDGVDVKDGNTNYDVKVCEAYKTPRGGFQWVFNRNNYKEHIHYYACIALKGGKPQRLLILPSEDFPKSGMTIGNKSKYDVYSIPI